jgi:cytochrome b
MPERPGPTREVMTMRQVKVWDLFVRIAHWGLGLLVLGSFLTSEVDRLVPVHVRIGLAILAVVTARIVYGFLGSAPARFGAFVKGPREVLAYARTLASGRRPPLHLSHNPLGGAMVVALLVTLLGTVATGAVFYAGPHFGGALAAVLTRHDAKLVKELHEALATGLLVLVGLHVAGVLFSSWREGQNLVRGMIDGRKRFPDAPAHVPATAPAPRAASRAARLVASLGAGALTALAVAAPLGIPARARAAAPAAAAAGQLRAWEDQARRERPGFAGFSAAEGRKLYVSEHVQDGQKVSCATCHTANPRADGRTPAGKLVEPLSPAVNPARFGDAAETEKWFKRNCKQVLGRECTAEEKGHFVTYVLGA